MINRKKNLDIIDYNILKHPESSNTSLFVKKNKIIILDKLFYLICLQFTFNTPSINRHTCNMKASIPSGLHYQILNGHVCLQNYLTINSRQISY